MSTSTTRAVAREGDTQRATRLVIGAAVLVAVVLVVLAFLLTSPPRDGVVIAVMAVVVLLAYLGPRRLVAAGAGFNIGALTVLATIPLAGGLSAAIVGCVSVVATWSRLSSRAKAFNTANMAAMGSAGGMAYDLTVGDIGITATVADVGLLGLGLLVAVVVVVVVNTGFVAAVMSTSGQTRFGTTSRELVTRMGPSYLTFAVVALLVDVLWLTIGLGPLAIVLAAPFIWGVRWTTGQFADENRTREWVIRAAQAALDARFPGAARRSERVARWSAAIAEEAGLPVRTILRAQTVGALIDVDLLTLPGATGHRATAAFNGLSFTTGLTGADPDPEPRRIARLATEVVTHLDEGTPLVRGAPGLVADGHAPHRRPRPRPRPGLGHRRGGEAVTSTGVQWTRTQRDATLVTLGAMLFASAALVVWLRSGITVPTGRVSLVAACIAAFGIGEYAVLTLGDRTLAPIATAAGIGLAMTPLVGEGSWLGIAYVLTLVASIQVVATAVRAFRGLPLHTTESSVRLLAIAVVAVAARIPRAGEASFVGHDAAAVVAGARTTALWALGLALLGVLIELGLAAFIRSRSLPATLVRLVRLDLSEAGGLSLATASAAAAIAAAFPVIGAVAVPLFTVPLVLVQVGMGRYHLGESDRRVSLLTMARLTDETGHTTPAHAESVAELSVAAARVLGVADAELDSIRTAALLHDVGQVALDTPIPGGATVLAAPSDQQQIAEATLRIVRAAGSPEGVLMILEHQTTAFRRVREFGDPVPVGARILKAANAYIDLTSGSSSPRVHARAMERLTLGLGYEYDPAVIRALEVVHAARD